MEAAVSKMASSLVWRTGQEIDVPVPQIKEVPATKQETVEGMGEMPEIIVVSAAVEGISPLEPVQQLTIEQTEDVPQFREETAEVVELLLHERVQQRSAEEIEDFPQYPKESGEVVTSVPREQAQQRTSLTDQEKQLRHSHRNMGGCVRDMINPAWLREGFCCIGSAYSFRVVRLLQAADSPALVVL